MSTEFVSQMTGEMGFVRWSRHNEDGSRTAFEFGTVTNFERVTSMMRMGDVFVPQGASSLEGDPTSVEDVERMVATGRATFGEFCVTVEVGSGDMMRFTQEE